MNGKKVKSILRGGLTLGLIVLLATGCGNNNVTNQIDSSARVESGKDISKEIRQEDSDIGEERADSSMVSQDNDVSGENAATSDPGANESSRESASGKDEKNDSKKQDTMKDESEEEGKVEDSSGSSGTRGGSKGTKTDSKTGRGSKNGEDNSSEDVSDEDESKVSSTEKTESNDQDGLKNPTPTPKAKGKTEKEGKKPKATPTPKQAGKNPTPTPKAADKKPTLTPKAADKNPTPTPKAAGKTEKEGKKPKATPSPMPTTRPTPTPVPEGTPVVVGKTESGEVLYDSNIGETKEGPGDSIRGADGVDTVKVEPEELPDNTEPEGTRRRTNRELPEV